MLTVRLGGAALAALVLTAGAQASPGPARPVPLERNLGQSHPDALFVARGPGFTAFLTREGVTLVRTSRPRVDGDRAVSEIALPGAAPSIRVEGVDSLPGRRHYLRGGEPSRWVRDVRVFRAVRYRGAYPGIDLRFEAWTDGVRLRLEARPGTRARSVRLLVNGEEIEVGPGPSAARLLSVRAPNDDPSESRSALRATAGTPLLAYSTFSGGSAGDHALDIAVDREGAAYVTGFTTSVDFPVVGGVQQTSGGGIDVFVTKYDALGAWVYSTYLGGSAGENGFGIAVDRRGQAIIAGNTGSADFPVFHALQPSLSGSQDAFVTKLSRDGSSLRYSTYLGGPDNPALGSQGDVAFDVAVTAGSEAYVAGLTPSLEFPTTAGAFQESHGGDFDAFVTRLSADGSSLEYSTYLGGAKSERAEAIRADRQGHAYVAGSTTSDDFPTASPLFPSYSGLNDAFVAQLSPDGSSLVYSTYLGGAGDDLAEGLALQRDGRVTVTGWTSSTDYPLAGPFFRGGFGEDVFLTRLEAGGSALVYSTLVGGSDLDIAHDVAVDRRGTAYVTGRTWSHDFPLERPIQNKMSFEDAFVFKLSPSGRRLVYSTYLGGANVVTSVQAGQGIDARAGCAWIAGETDASDFPVVDAQQPVYGGGSSDAFVTKIVD